MSTPDPVFPFYEFDRGRKITLKLSDGTFEEVEPGWIADDRGVFGTGTKTGSLHFYWAACIIRLVQAKAEA